MINIHKIFSFVGNISEPNSFFHGSMTKCITVLKINLKFLKIVIMKFKRKVHNARPLYDSKFNKKQSRIQNDLHACINFKFCVSSMFLIAIMERRAPTMLLVHLLSSKHLFLVSIGTNY